MKGKTFVILGIGAAGGFILGGTFTFCKIMESKKMQEAFSSILANKITDILFDGDNVTVRVNRPNASYRSYYDKTRRPSCYAVEGVAFDTRNAAKEVLEQMQDIIDNYGCVCIQDYYDLCGLSNKYHREGKWGWTILNEVQISKYHDGWHIDLPKAVPVS